MWSWAHEDTWYGWRSATNWVWRNRGRWVNKKSKAGDKNILQKDKGRSSVLGGGRGKRLWTEEDHWIGWKTAKRKVPSHSTSSHFLYFCHASDITTRKSSQLTHGYLYLVPRGLCLHFQKASRYFLMPSSRVPASLINASRLMGTVHAAAQQCDSACLVRGILPCTGKVLGRAGMLGSSQLYLAGEYILSFVLL